MTQDPSAPAAVRAGPVARLPTDHGEFQVQTWHDPQTGVDHLAMWMGEPAGAREWLVRVHSECLTGDVLGSTRCDCGPQLRLAQQRIAQAGAGMVVYMRGHEGRGIGLAEKLRAYALQDQGLDTVDANLALGHPVDARRFDAAADILRQMGVASIRLMSNNPAKVQALRALGVEVVAREPHEAGLHAQNAHYLATKRMRLGHRFVLDEEDTAP